MRLNFLAPDIVLAILNGRQPVPLTASKLMADTRLPLELVGAAQGLGLRLSRNVFKGLFLTGPRR